LERTYRDRGVAFLMVNPKKHEDVEAMRGARERYKLEMGYVHDPEVKLGIALKADSTTDVFVLDGARTLVYRGAVDDQYGFGYSLPAAKKNYLVDALEAVLGGREVAVKATSAPGCDFPVKVEDARAEAAKVTWHNRVSRIVQNNCQECHRAGEPAPFSLVSYEDVEDNLATIRRVVEKKFMPPWFAEGGKETWANHRALSEADREDLLAWIGAGAPVGDEKDAPLARKWVEGWRIGRPDAVYSVEQPIAVAAQGVMDYQNVLVKTNLTADKWVRAVEVRGSQPQVIHHVLVFVVFPKDHPRAKEQPRHRGGLSGYFAGMVPGAGVSVFPEGTAKFLPRGASLVFQIHYTPNGEAVEDRPRMGVIFAEKPEREVATRAAFDNKFRIPPGASDHEIVGEYTFREAQRIFSFSPHSHLRGKAFKYELIDSAGKARTVLDIPKYDFNWQLVYELRRPIDVAAGTRLRVTARYDNSEKNPANPDPTKWVTFGEQTSDEMMIGYFTSHPIGG
jgi:mono/diheme cytochrome c family protein